MFVVRVGFLGAGLEGIILGTTGRVDAVFGGGSGFGVGFVLGVVMLWGWFSLFLRCVKIYVTFLFELWR